MKRENLLLMACLTLIGRASLDACTCIKKKGFDAVVFLWYTVAEHENGFDKKLYEWSKNWLENNWPFSPTRVAFPVKELLHV